MTRTEEDLRLLYAELADEAPTGDALLSQLGQRRQQPAAKGSRRIRVVAGGLLAAAAISIGTLLLPSGPHSGTGQAAAATILSQAAQATSLQSDVVPRADQFLYLKTDGAEDWLSIDGTHNGGYVSSAGVKTVSYGCRDGVTLEPERPQPCTPQPAYLADLPATQDGMTAYLSRTYGSDVNRTGKGIFDLLEFHYLRPAVRAALFRAATQFPGLSVVRDPALGPDVIGVRWTEGPSSDPNIGQSSATLLFDATTHAFAGIRTTGIKGEAGAGGAPSATAIVDDVGQRP